MAKQKITKKGYVRIGLPDYLPWKLAEIEDVLMKELGWKTPDKGKDHIDCKFASTKYYLKNQQRPGFIFKQEKFSQMIRDGQMTREDAMLELEKLSLKDGKPENFNDFLETLGLSEEDIKDIKNKSHLNHISKDELKSEESLSFKLLAAPYRIFKRF